MKDKDLKKLMKDSENYILATDKGMAILGDSANILTLYTLITKQLLNCNGVDKELLDKAYEIAFKNTEEILQMTIDNLLNKIGGK